MDEKEIAALTATPQSVFSSNIVNGQLVLHPQTPVTAQPGHQTPTTNSDTGTDTKKRKRARCGNCSGCLNRDKTQDCRQCRNCLDQKRYGGPGRLKKACIKRQCVVISQVIIKKKSQVMIIYIPFLLLIIKYCFLFRLVAQLTQVQMTISQCQHLLLLLLVRCQL